MVFAILLTAVLSYLLGNLNGAILLSRLVEKDDVRNHGSGNAGFTNFFRNYGKSTSLLVILIDGLKTALSCLLGGWLLVTDWRVGLTLLALFAVTYLLTKLVSLASMVSALAFGILFAALYPGHPFVLAIALIMMLLTVFLHRSNLKRLVKGQETKTEFFKRRGKEK